jgi:cellulose synthase operon protein C
MIVHFPDLYILQLTLTTGAVPPDVAQKSAVAGFDEQAHIWVETAAKLPVAAQRELKRLGALVCKSSGVPLDREVSCWLELLPLVRDDAPLSTLEKMPVLFDVPSGEELSRLVLEMLRLGNDRQSYRWLEERKNSNDGRALLRVVGPPYYSLLRAIDQLGGPDKAPHAFAEHAPGVWIEVGFRHPLADNIRPPKGKILLLRPPRQWLMLPDAPFRDIYEIVEFQLPDGPTRWQDGSLPHRLTVVPRVRQAGPAEGTELWVLRGDAIDELNRFVQNAEDQLLNRLAFAVGEKNGQTVVVLRVRQSKLPPPVLVLPAEEYKSHLKLPNLFLPAGFALNPPLRRDVVRKLMAEDPRQITWLVSGENGSFTPEGLPDDVFRPLTDWVDYVLDRDREQLQAWVQAMQFEFEPFVCEEEQPSKPKKPPAAEKTHGPKTSPARPAAQGETGETTGFETPSGPATEAHILKAFAAVETMEPSEIEKELQAVEEEFLALPGGLDDASRRTLWPRLAELNGRLMKWEDAGICWLHALWDADDDAGKWAASWFDTEAKAAARNPASGGAQVVDNLDHLLASPEPATANLRALAAYLAWSARREPRPAALIQRLPAIQRFLQMHEKMLPVRACWLAWYHLVQLTDGDVLSLARARDRLLERLFHNGLRSEQDLPSFLRFAGQPNDRRGRDLGQWMLKLHELARRWVDRQRGQGAIEYKEAKTKEYIDLLFAFGLARLGEHDASRELLLRSQKALVKEDKAHALLFRLFEHRIRQAMEGQATNTPLEGESLERLNELRRIEQARRTEEKKQSGPPHSYVVDKMRGTSRILEPLQNSRVFEYRYIAAGSGGEEDQALARLPDIKDRKELAEQTNWLLQKGKTSLPLSVRILKGALEQSPRIGEEIAQHLLEQALRGYDRSFSLPVDDKERPGPEQLMDLLERGLFVAAHFGRLDAVQALMARFRQLLREERESPSTIGFDRVIEQCLRGLRKLGLRDEIEELLALMSDAVLKGRNAGSLLTEKDAGPLVRTLLPIAAGWYDFGRDSQAEPIFQAARTLLLRKELAPTEHLALACAYANTLGAVPITIAQERLEELFERLEGIPNTSSYGNYYSPAQIKFIESVVLAVAGDDFTQGSQERRWLDEDEYLVRQRIHSDHLKMVGATGA